MSSWPPAQPERAKKEAAGAAAGFPGAGCRSLRGRPSGLKAAAHRQADGPCGPGLDPGDHCGPSRQYQGPGQQPAPAATQHPA